MTKAPFPVPGNEYRTRRGDRVVIHKVRDFNNAGARSTFPVKGTVYWRGRARKKSFQIWTLDGRASVLRQHPHDIIEITPLPRQGEAANP